MNILELSKPFDHGGVAEHIITLSKKLSDNGHRVIVASENGNHVENLNAIGLKHQIIRFSSKNPINILKEIFKLKKIIKNENIEIVHCHYRMCALYMQILRFFKMTKVPYVWSNHLNNINHSFIYRMFTFYGEKAITVSTELKHFLNVKFRIPENKIAVVLNGIDIERFERQSNDKITEIKGRYKLAANEKIVTLLGRLLPVKGHECAIRAFAQLLQKIDNRGTTLLITGEGPAEYKASLLELASKLKVKDKVIFTGQVDANEILSITDLLVAPSLNEGFPIAIIEAFAMRVPVIRTKTAGYSDTQDVCLGMEIGDVDYLAITMNSILSNNKDVSEMVEDAHLFVNENCTVEKMTEKITNIYREAISRKIQ